MIVFVAHGLNDGPQSCGSKTSQSTIGYGLIFLLGLWFQFPQTISL